MAEASPALVKRFWAKTQKANGCAVWTSGRDSWGYGKFTAQGKTLNAHRVAWTLVYGPIPAGMCVLHKCDNPPCVEVAHLFLGTHKDNAMDRDTKGRDGNSTKTECPRGHPYSGANLYVTPRGYRNCRECNSGSVVRYRRRRALALGLRNKPSK